MSSLQSRLKARSTCLGFAAFALLSTVFCAPAIAQTEGSEAPPAEKIDEDVKPLGSSRHLTVLARSLKLTRTARQRLLAIAARYYDATGKPLTITGGDRDAASQARLMYKKLKNGEDLIKLYARDALVRPIVEAYETGKAEERSERSVLRAMTKVIEAQMSEGQFVSRHLSFTAADVRSRGMSDEQLEALRAAVKAEAGVQLLDERDSTAPHLHLGL